MVRVISLGCQGNAQQEETPARRQLLPPKRIAAVVLFSVGELFLNAFQA